MKPSIQARKTDPKDDLISKFSELLDKAWDEGHEIKWIYDWANNAQDEFIENLESGWITFVKDKSDSTLTPYQNFKNYLEEFEDDWNNDDGFSGEDRVGVKFFGNIDELEDEDLTMALRIGDDEDAGYWHDPYGGEVLRYKGQPFGDGVYELGDKFHRVTEESSKFTDYVEDGSMYDIPEIKMFKKLRKLDIPFVVVSTSRGSFIAIPKELKSKYPEYFK